MAAGKQELIVARDDAIYTYGAEGRVQTLAYGGASNCTAYTPDNLLILRTKIGNLCLSG
jgi:hypothetical protein